MKIFWAVAALSALVPLTIDTAGATAKHRHRHYAAPVAVALMTSFAPERDRGYLELRLHHRRRLRALPPLQRRQEVISTRPARRRR